MKELTFQIAQKIASENKNPKTVLICASILKTFFINEGYSDKVANTMAIDGIKLIVKAMFSTVNKLFNN